jgi:drug/metabolite transporter (DMT)-like permease
LNAEGDEAQPMNRAMNVTDWALLLTAAVLLGSSFLFLNIAVQEIPPLTSAALRTLIAAPICYGLMRAFGARLPTTAQGWIALFWLGLLTGAIPFTAISWGQQHIASGMGGILFGTMPILAVVLAPIFLEEETFTRRRLVGAVIGLAGIILLIGPSVLANAGDQVLGIIITFCAPLSHTLGAIYARKQGNIPPPTMTVGQMIFGGAILIPLAFAAESPLSLNPSTQAIGAILIAGVFSTAIAMSLYFVIVRRIGAARSSLVPLFFPVVAVILGTIVLGEQLPLEAFGGLALILLGAIAVSARAPAKRSG